MIKTDFHMHTNASTDCPAGMEDMIKQAVSVGLSEICITDHVDFLLVDDIRNWDVIGGAEVSSLLEWASILEDGETCKLVRVAFDEYISDYEHLASFYESEISVLMGCEIGLSYHCRDAIYDHASRYPFDFIIGSQHTADRYDICCNRDTYFHGKTKREAYSAHLQEILQNVRNYDCFDVLGHIDYIIRYGPYEDRRIHVHEFDDLLSAIFKTLVEKGKGIELNTSGFRYGLGHAHPHIDILRKFREVGGEIITVGSDAHGPRDVGKFLGEAAEMLREAGFKAYCSFKERKPTFIDF